MWFTLVFKVDHSWVHTQREMMHKQSRDYTEDLWGVLSIKIQKTNTNIHLPAHRLNMLHWLGARPKLVSEEGREIQTGRMKERDTHTQSMEGSGLVWCCFICFLGLCSNLQSVFKCVRERIQVGIIGYNIPIVQYVSVQMVESHINIQPICSAGEKRGIGTQESKVWGVIQQSCCNKFASCHVG